MTTEEFEALVNEVLGGIMELSPNFTLETMKEAFDKCLSSWAESEKSGRIQLLCYLLKEIQACEGCSRHLFRMNTVPAEGALDSIMLVGDYPTYLDSMVGGVFTSVGTLLASRCGSCSKLEEHIGSFVYDSNLPKLEPKDFVCDYTPAKVVKGKIPLPVVFTNNTSVLMPLQSAGQILDRLLLDLEQSRNTWRRKSSLYITNMMMCPSLKEDGTNAPITSAERKACKPWFELQLKVVKPKMVICLGSKSYAYFFKDKFTDNVGLLRTLSTYPFVIGSTYHPGVVIQFLGTDRADFLYKEMAKNLETYLNMYESDYK